MGAECGSRTAAAPKPAPRRLVSLDSLHLIRGVGRFTRRGGSRYSEDLTGLRSFCACHAFLSKCPVFDHACCLPPVRQTERLAICSVPVPPWVVIAIRAFSDVAWLSGFVGSLRACAFLYGDPDGERRDAENGVGGEAKCVLREHIGFAVFSAGSPLGAARPQTCAKETRLPGLSSFDSRCGCVLRGEGLGYSEDLTASNLWPDGSGCMRRPFLAWHGGKWNRHNPAVN